MMAKILIGYVVITGGVFLFQRQMLYHPTDRAMHPVMERWEVEGETRGFPWGHR